MRGPSRIVKPVPASYRHIAGVSLERLAALSDGIFAVAMTLLVLGLSVRAGAALHPARPLWAPGALASEHVVNIALLGALLYAGARYARRARLLKQEVTAEMTAASERRIIAYQTLYASGALLSVLSTYLSIGFIFAVQLNAAITPRIWRLDRF